MDPIALALTFFFIILIVVLLGLTIKIIPQSMLMSLKDWGPIRIPCLKAYT